MGGDWVELAWGDLATLEYGRALRGHAESRGRFRVFGTNGPIGWHDEPLCPHTTVVIGRKGAYRGVHFSPGPCFVIDTAFYLEPKGEIDVRWAYYHLLTQDINAMDSGSAIPSTSREEFYNLAVRVPPLPEQRAIAHILGTLDDKIELNRQMSETLEAMARALFKSWFIDFDPVRRNMARARGQNQPSPLPPLPGGEGRRPNYRGGYDFAGLVETARALRKKQTSAETVFWELVRDRRFLGLKFRRQHQLGDYVADFYCHEHRLVIEFDGGIHSGKQRKDHKRDAWMVAQGFKVLRFKNEQLLDDPESVLSAIAHSIEEPPSPSGRRVGDEGVVESCAFDHLFPARLVPSELGEIPEGWEVGPLGQFFAVGLGGAWGHEERTTRATTSVRCLRGIDCHDLAEGRIPDVPLRWLTTKQVEDRRLPDGAILIEGSGSFCGRSLMWRRAYEDLIGGPVCYSNFCKRLDPRCTPAQAVICWMQMREAYQDGVLQSFRTGTAFPNFDIHGALANLIVVVPPEPLAGAFAETFTLSQRIDLMVQSRTLAALRDALLPKLISGQLRVKDAERFLKERGL